MRGSFADVRKPAGRHRRGAGRRGLHESRRRAQSDVGKAPYGAADVASDHSLGGEKARGANAALFTQLPHGASKFASEK